LGSAGGARPFFVSASFNDPAMQKRSTVVSSKRPPQRGSSVQGVLL
jgi:hypothetical protein